MARISRIACHFRSSALPRQRRCYTDSRQPATQEPSPVAWTYLPGLLPYELGLAIQEQLVAARLHAVARLEAEPGLQDAEVRRTAETDVLLLLQHQPVYTTGRRDNDAHLLELEGTRLRALGADYIATARGGQTTYHGPGQLVGYPIYNMGATGMRTRTYVCQLERFLTALLARYDIPVVDSPHVGTFVDANSKIASIGIQVRHRITSHGFALNVEDAVKPWFAQIIACGLTDVRATTMNSMRHTRQADAQVLCVDDIIAHVVSEFGRAFGRRMRPLSAQEAKAVTSTLAATVGS